MLQSGCKVLCIYALKEWNVFLPDGLYLACDLSDLCVISHLVAMYDADLLWINDDDYYY